MYVNWHKRINISCEFFIFLFIEKILHRYAGDGKLECHFPYIAYMKINRFCYNKNIFVDIFCSWFDNSVYSFGALKYKIAEAYWTCCTEKTIFPFPFTLNGIRSWWQLSFRFWTKWNSIWFKIERKTVTTIISHSMWKEMEI